MAGENCELDDDEVILPKQLDRHTPTPSHPSSASISLLPFHLPLGRSHVAADTHSIIAKDKMNARELL
jgi:hypothetical protein